MYQSVRIEGLDHYGRGIAHVDGVIVFVDNALPSEVVDIEIINEKSRFKEARVLKYVVKSDKRIESVCPYFGVCGGCALLHLEYSDTLNFKKNKVRELLAKNKINYDKDIEVIENVNSFNYRNKLSLKIVNGNIGFYESKSHNLVEIKECKVANPVINKVIENYKLLGVLNGSLVVRVNSNNEVLLVINADSDNYQIELDKLREKVKLVGIVYNDKLIYGNDFYYERTSGLLLKVSYNSFFQVNSYIASVLFDLIKNSIPLNSLVLDLYSGVGSLSIPASFKAREVLGVEIVKNAVINASFNAKINKKDNLKFLLGDTSDVVNKLNKDFDVIIVDPPRSGLDKKTRAFLKEVSPKEIIYVSCDANTLMRDLKDLEDLYMIEDYKILDMFSYSYHLESFVKLKRCK